MEDRNISTPEPTYIPVEDEARLAVDGRRMEDYGSPALNHTRTAVLWDAYLEAKGDGPLDPQDVCNLNILQKMSRNMNCYTRDGIVDIIGYAINLAKLEGFDAN